MRESVDMLRQILVYNPERRLSGTNFLTNMDFNDLFFENSLRFNGKRIQCLSLLDLEAVKFGDDPMEAMAMEEMVYLDTTDA
ncbi:hypothetical protein CAEBREN_08596 [Caenorhabditis brenneri]|uniref:Uncharacterized protein n=1 Tax=Caenorhabditis brenneri TaxID=135651 RepID=G0MZM4_CAEBE|nr:hypothetical protein CAEBREN_08596 [Caenorhabditis brenneri]